MLRSFRLVCANDQIPLVQALLQAEGYDFENDAFSPYCRILTHEPKPLGSSLAAFFGYIYIQDRSSMLPPLALANVSEDKVLSALDMCASPGSKTGFLGQLLGKNSFVLGNEPSKSRLATLRVNMHNLNMLNIGTCSYEGQAIPNITQENDSGNWDLIQLDPPCSGWGTVKKNPQVLNLWQGEKVKPLIGIQRMLLQRAWKLLRPGGEMVYSTCTTNFDENEAQVHYAVNELGFELIPLEPFAGFTWDEPQNYNGLELATTTLKVDGERSNAQGFYIAKFRKPYNSQNCAKQLINYETNNLFIIENSLDQSILDKACVDISLLPNGQLGLFGDTVYFIAQKALNTLGKNMQWQGFMLGKFSDNTLRLHPRCRALMPNKPTEQAVILDSTDKIRQLLQGQSLQTTLVGKQAGLYFEHQGQVLSLGRLTLKNKRALWSAR